MIMKKNIWKVFWVRIILKIRLRKTALLYFHLHCSDEKYAIILYLCSSAHTVSEQYDYALTWGSFLHSFTFISLSLLRFLNLWIYYFHKVGEISAIITSNMFCHLPCSRITITNILGNLRLLHIFFSLCFIFGWFL